MNKRFAGWRLPAFVAAGIICLLVGIKLMLMKTSGEESVGLPAGIGLSEEPKAPLPLNGSGDSRSLNDEEEKKILSKYEELKKELQVLERRLPSGKLKEFRAAQLRLAKIFVLDNSAFQSGMHELFNEVLSYKKSFPWIKADDARALLAEFGDASPKAHVLAALLADDALMLKETLEKFPDDRDVLMAYLINDGDFLKNNDLVTRYERISPDSPWPAILKTISEMKSGNAAGAANSLKSALSHEITPFESGYGETWASMSEFFQSKSNERRQWPATAEDLFSKRGGDLLGDIILSAPDFYRQHKGEPEAAVFAAAALALSERAAETGNLVGERVALMNQLDILTMMGPEAAQPYLDIPYQEYLDSLSDRRETLRGLIETVDSFKQTLTPAQRTEFEGLEAVNGGLAAYEAMRPK